MMGIFPKDLQFNDDGGAMELKKPENLPNMDVNSVKENKEVKAGQSPQDLYNSLEYDEGLDEALFHWNVEMPPTPEQKLMQQLERLNPEDELERSKLYLEYFSSNCPDKVKSELCDLGYDVPDLALPCEDHPVLALRTCRQSPTVPGKNPCETTIHEDLEKNESK